MKVIIPTVFKTEGERSRRRGGRKEKQYFFGAVRGIKPEPTERSVQHTLT